MSSEDALKNLEKSADEPLLLLDQAAGIVHLRYDSELGEFVRNKSLPSASDAQEFRFQWLLKWLLKNFQNQGNSKSSAKHKLRHRPNGEQLLGSDKAWALLVVLLQSISTAALRNILLERNFTHLLILARTHLQREPGPSTLSHSSHEVIDDRSSTDYHTQKKRRLSPLLPDAILSQEDGCSSHDRGRFLSAYIRVLRRYADVIQAPSSSPAESSFRPWRSMPAAWAPDLDNAAHLVSCVLQAVISACNEASELVSITVACSAAVDWLQLWHEYATSSALDVKLVNKSFSEICLNSCLELFVLLQRTLTQDAERVFRKTLERQIAYHVILPLRSSFNALFSIQWKTMRDHISWDAVQPLYNEVVLHLGNSLHSAKVMGVDYVSFNHEHYASNLLQIAARLLPRDDVRRQQWENAWLNALFTVLMHLAFPQHLYRLQANKEGLLEAENEDLPFDSASTAGGPYQLLAALQAEEIRLASSTTLYVFSSVLRWRNGPLPATVLFQLTQLDATAFVPQVGNPNAETCLDLLLDQVRDQNIQSTSDFQLLVDGIMIPVMRAFARSRDIQGFVELWTTRLQDAFITRLNDQQDTLDPALVFDDESMFSAFEAIIKAEAPQGYGKEIVQSVRENLQGIASRIGPTTDIFSQLAILCCVVRARANSLTSSGLDIDVPGMTSDVILALQQKSDYQGQRWRLWAFLKLLLANSPELIQRRDLHELIMVHISSLEALGKEKMARFTSASLMESLQVSYIVIDNGLRLGTECEKLAKCLQSVLSRLMHKKNDGIESRFGWLSNAWDGRLSTLKSIDHLTHGLLGYLIGQFPGNLKPFTTFLLADVQRIAFEASSALPNNAIHGASLAALFQNLLASFSKEDDSSLFAYYGDMLVLEQGITVPFIMHGLPLDGLEKKKAKAYADYLAQRLVGYSHSETPVLANELVSNLALLAKIVTEFPVSIGMLKHFSKLLQVARVTDVLWDTSSKELAMDLETSLALCIRSLGRILEVAWTRCLSLEGEKQSVLKERLVRWFGSTTDNLTTQDALPSDIILLDIVLALFRDHAGRITGDNPTSGYEDRYMDILISLSDDPRRKPLAKHLAASDGLFSRELKKVRNPIERSRFSERLQSTALCRQTSAGEQYKFDRESIAGDSDQTRHGNFGELRNLIRQVSDETRVHEPDHLSNTILIVSQSRHTSLKLATTVKIVNALLEIDTHEIERNQELAAMIATLACPDSSILGKSVDDLIFELEICQIVLVHHQGVIGQATIDKLLSSLAIASSSSWRVQAAHPKDSYSKKHSKGVAVHSRLTTVFGILLSRYRRRLNGRSHLVSTLLQNLLRCLFYTPDRKYLYQNPATIKQKQAFRSSLPDWLSHGGQEALPSTCAENFARLLSSICNPSTASARSAQRGKRTHTNPSLDLNDETKKAKKIASQYMQYVLAEYARSALDGVITPEARDKLMPGLFSILDAMDRDTMKVVNTTMDASSRAIFKELYDDWTRFGKWNQT